MSESIPAGEEIFIGDMVYIGQDGKLYRWKCEYDVKPGLWSTMHMVPEPEVDTPIIVGEKS